MVKGITRRIVEIKETGSDYFERAIFFVKMDMTQAPPEYTLTQEASRIIDDFCADLRLSRPSKKIRLLAWGKLLIAAAAGAGLTALLMCLI